MSQMSKEYKAAWYQANKERIKILRIAYREKNKERIAKSVFSYHASHKESVKKIKAKWRDNNKSYYVAKCAERYARKLNATPVWADLDAIRDVYIEAQYQQMHVDHTIPLKGKTVCGLHVWDNLQLLTERENCRKGNSWTP